MCSVLSSQTWQHHIAVHLQALPAPLHTLHGTLRTRHIPECLKTRIADQLQYGIQPGAVCLQDALQLTEAQQRGVLQLRRLFYSKLGALARERQALLMQVPSGAAETAAGISNQLGQFAEAAGALQNNSDAELKTYMQFLSAFGRGVSVLAVIHVAGSR